MLRTYIDQRTTKLAALQYLPELVNFYKLLNIHFAYRLTEEEAAALTVPKAIQVLKKYEPKAVIEDLTEKWEHFKLAWESIRNILAELVGCPDQQQNRQFESYILKVDDETLFSKLF